MLHKLVARAPLVASFGGRCDAPLDECATRCCIDGMDMDSMQPGARCLAPPAGFHAERSPGGTSKAANRSKLRRSDFRSLAVAFVHAFRPFMRLLVHDAQLINLSS